jgi:hypothetical protein
MAVGDYEQIEKGRRRAWRLSRSLYDPVDREANARQYKELDEWRATYLRSLLERLPFRWHVEHAYTPRETATYGGADHIVVDEEVRVGRLVRQPGDALSRVRSRFWGLSRVEDERLPTSQADIQIAGRIVDKPSTAASKKLPAQLDREIADALGARRRRFM